MSASRPCSVHCILPPHLLKKLLEHSDPAIRLAALRTWLATTRLRAHRTLTAGSAFIATIAGEKRRTIYDCRNSSVTELAKIARTEGAAPTADSAVNDAYDGLGTTYDFYLSVLERNSIDGKGMRLNGYVHYSEMYNNAFWDGREMIFGDGDGQIFTSFTGSLDVIAHELTHGVTDYTASLEYHNQSGALNESISDVFGSLVKQWSLSQRAQDADWLIGADIFTPGIQADALRSLKNPGSAYNNDALGADPQPSHMSGYVELPDTDDGDFGGVHINSGIPNRAFYLAAIRMGGFAWEAPGHIWYEALKTAQPATDFAGFALLTHETAGRLYGTASNEQQAVQEAWDTVGVNFTGASAAALEPETGVDSQVELKQKLEELTREVRALSAKISGP